MIKKLCRISFLLLMIALFTLTGCSTSVVPMRVPEDQAMQTPTTEDNPFPEKLASLPSADFGAKAFRIATNSNTLIIPSGNTSIFDKALYQRNRAVEDKYNIRLTLTEESGLPTITSRIQREALAGSDYCDLILLDTAQFQVLVNSASLLNLRSIPYFDSLSDGYDQNSINATTRGSVTYGVCGELTLEPSNFYALFFNKDLLSKTELPNLYSLVRDNHWDFENFLVCAEELHSLGRVNGNRVYGFGSTESTENLVKMLWAASGGRYIDNTYGYVPQMDFDNDNTQAFITNSKKILFRSSSYLSNADTSKNAFIQGNLGFLAAPISIISDILESNINWGILPLPKADINQEHYYSYTERDYVVAGIAKGTTDPTMSGMVTNALFHASNGNMIDLHVQHYLNFYFECQEDGEMLLQLLKTPYYETVEFFGQGDPSHPYTACTQTLLYRVISTNADFKSLYNQNKKMFDKYIEQNNIK